MAQAQQPLSSVRQRRKATETPAKPNSTVYQELGSVIARGLVRDRSKKRRALYEEHLSLKRNRAKTRPVAPADSEEALGSAMAEWLEKSLATLSPEIKAALVTSLGGTTKATAVEGEGVAVAEANPTLTTAEVAVRLEVSRPYVSMLCDAGKLGPIIRTEGGHRRISQAGVDAYSAARRAEHAGAGSVREAGVDARLYDRDDEDYAVTDTRGEALPDAKRPAAAGKRKATA